VADAASSAVDVSSIGGNWSIRAQVARPTEGSAGDVSMAGAGIANPLDIHRVSSVSCQPD
jgi:hypothetical protein